MRLKKDIIDLIKMLMSFAKTAYLSTTEALAGDW